MGALVAACLACAVPALSPAWASAAATESALSGSHPDLGANGQFVLWLLGGATNDQATAP